MYAATLKSAAWKLTIWLAARVAAPRRCPLPLYGVRGVVAALLHSPHGAAIVTALALVVVVHGVRSAWWDIYGRWYGR